MIGGGPDAFILLTNGLKLFAVTGILALILTKKSTVAIWISGLGGALASLCLVASGWISMHSPALNMVYDLPSLPIFGQGSLHFDPFSGLFVLLLGSISAVACIYGIGYSKLYVGQHSLGWLGAMTNWFIGSMALVLVAANALNFLFAWEIMALTSFALVVYQHSDPHARQAGFIYAIMTQLGTAFLMIAFIIFSFNSGSLDFIAWTGIGAELTPRMATFAFFLLLLGFGTKAGLVPMHMWLPEAHPQAPSHISALMSGVMLKVAVYAFFRVFGLSLIEVMQPWWGLVVMTLGGISALVGVFYAIERRDMKKSLAFSSIENIGIIFIGVGAAMYFLAIHQPGFALLAAVAALLHCVNHAVLKSLLFMGAGSVYYSFHTRSMTLLGGAAKYLPLTSIVFLIGAIGLMGLPPLNAFASEWLTLQTLLAGINQTGLDARFTFPLVLSALAAAAGLAFVVFTRMFGIVFLGLPRTAIDPEHPPKRTPWAMQVAMTMLAVAALGLSIFMYKVIPSLVAVWPKTWFGAKTAGRPEVQNMLSQLTNPFQVLDIDSTIHAVGSTAGVALGFLAGTILLAWLVIRILGGKKRVVEGPSWDCGFPLNERMQYSGLGFTSPVRHALRFFLRPKEQVAVSQGQHNFYFWHVRTYATETLSFFDQFVVKPIGKAFAHTGKAVKRVQSGHLYIYLSYMLVALIALLLLAKFI